MVISYTMFFGNPGRSQRLDVRPGARMATIHPGTV